MNLPFITPCVSYMRKWFFFSIFCLYNVIWYECLHWFRVYIFYNKGSLLFFRGDANQCNNSVDFFRKRFPLNFLKETIFVFCKYYMLIFLVDTKSLWKETNQMLDFEKSFQNLLKFSLNTQDCFYMPDKTFATFNKILNYVFQCQLRFASLRMSALLSTLDQELWYFF